MSGRTISNAKPLGVFKTCPFCDLGMPLQNHPFEREPVHIIDTVRMPCMTLQVASSPEKHHA